MTLADTNPRFVAYCISQGRSPEAQRDYDAAAFPGGKMAGFILWSRAAINAYGSEAEGRIFNGGIVDAAHYDAWLVGYAMKERSLSDALDVIGVLHRASKVSGSRDWFDANGELIGTYDVFGGLAKLRVIVAEAGSQRPSQAA